MNLYTTALASDSNKSELGKLWMEFANERIQHDPSIAVENNFDFEKYVGYQLAKSLTFCWQLEQTDENSSGDKTTVGFLLGRYHDESPPRNLSQTLLDRHRLNHPYQYRRVGSVLALYVQPKHRNPEAIKLLVNVALQHAESMAVTDIDLMAGAQLGGLQSLLEKLGFTRTAVQYTRHYDLPDNIERPDLHPPIPSVDGFNPPAHQSIPLRDPKTGDIIKGPQDNPVFLHPLEDVAQGEAPQLAVYPTPVRDPQTQNFVFDSTGQLVVCPVLKDENGNIFTYKGIPQFQTPAYAYVEGKLQLKQDAEGNYLFCDAERDSTGKILCNSQGAIIFQKPLVRR